MWTVYVLKGQKTGTHYIGCSNGLERRLEEHNSGYNRATKRQGPWSVVYKEMFAVRKDGYAREKQIKSYKGGNAFKELLKTK